MAVRNTEQAFDAPIAGMSLTHEVGARPWQTPPEMVTLEEAVQFYLPKLSSKEFVGRLLDIIETGVPLTALAEVITLGGVMQGLHSVDVAVLVNPILVEFMANMAEKAGIKYTLGDTDGKEDTPDVILISRAMKNLKRQNIFDDDELEETEEEETVEEPAPTGLMARKGSK